MRPLSFLTASHGHDDRRRGEALAVVGRDRFALKRYPPTGSKLIKLLVTIGGFGFPLAPKMGGSSPTTRPLAASEFLVRYANHLDREEAEELCRYWARPLCPQKDPLDSISQAADLSAETETIVGGGDGGDGSGGDVAIAIKLSITRASLNNLASVGGKSALKTGLT